MKRTYRASSLPLIKVCPSSPAQSEGKMFDTHVEGRVIGSALHDALAQACVEGREAVRVLQHAATYNADPEEVSRIWDRFTFDPIGGEAEAEVVLLDDDGDVRLTGHIDWRKEVATRTWTVVDYKSTRDAEAEPEIWAHLQILAYGVMTLFEKDADTVYVQIAFLRRGDEGWSSQYPITRADADRIRRDILQILELADEQYGHFPGERSYVINPKCTFCRGLEDCPAANSAALAALNMVARDGRKIQVYPPTDLDSVIERYSIAKAMRQAADALMRDVRSFTGALGPIPVGDGKELALRERKRLDKMVPTLGIYPEREDL